jgi:hypothetical protein
MGKKSGSGSGLNNRIIQYFRELKNKFLGKILKFFDADPGSAMEKIRIRDKHPGSATLIGVLSDVVCHCFLFFAYRAGTGGPLFLSAGRRVSTRGFERPFPWYRPHAAGTVPFSNGYSNTFWPESHLVDFARVYPGSFRSHNLSHNRICPNHVHKRANFNNKVHILALF